MIVKRISQIRLEKSLRDRETLTPCDACNGRGRHVTETATGYRGTICRWCDGVGSTPTAVKKMFYRAKRISGFWGRAA